MLIQEPIVTPRLILRPEQPEDADAIHAMNCDPRVMRYIGGGAWTSPVSEFREQFRQALARNADKPWGGVAVMLRETGAYIGLCWLAPCTFFDGAIELGYRYVPSAWGRGLATEAAERIVPIGFQKLHLDVIRSAVHPDNAGSIRVLDKLGFQRRQDMYHPSSGHDVRVYELTEADWETRRE